MSVRTAKRRKPLRLKEYDYSQPGAYFVTICTKDREYRFGEIANGEMQVNDLGRVVQSCWSDLPSHYPNVQLDGFVVMPNHVHGIVIITDNLVGATQGRTGDESTVGDGLRPSPTGPPPTQNHPLSEIIRAFKSFSARRINEISNTPGIPVWQRGYYDHIIRDDRSLNRIRDYIIANPQRWVSDKQNVGSIGDDEFDRWMNSQAFKLDRESKQ